MKVSWTTKLILSLALLSACFYGINYLVFRDPSFMLRLVTLQLGFVPISVLLITLFLNRLIANREKSMRLEKVNTIIGSFFSEVGTPLLKLFRDFDPKCHELSQKLIPTSEWSDADFRDARLYVRGRDHTVQIQKDKLTGLREFLLGKRIFLLSLMGNGVLLEHESFTDLLTAVFHLTEELAYRVDVTKLSDADYQHLSDDIKRAYTALVSEWLGYMRHLKDNYPYFYSLATRINPLNPKACAEFA
jgi:hypothetical protein